jgi:hypothetical protein
MANTKYYIEREILNTAFDEATGTLKTSGGGGGSGGEVVGNVAHDAADSGKPVKVGGVYKASPVAVSDGDRTDILTDEFGQQKVVVLGIPTFKKASGGGNSSATVTQVAAATSSTTLIASNSSRFAVNIVNDSSATLYLKFGTSASTTSYTVKLYTDDVYTVYGSEYTGIITGIWSSATGNAYVTEV